MNAIYLNEDFTTMLEFTAVVIEKIDVFGSLEIVTNMLPNVVVKGYNSLEDAKRKAVEQFESSLIGRQLIEVRLNYYRPYSVIHDKWISVYKK